MQVFKKNICIAGVYSVIKNRWDGIPLTGLSSLHFCTCSKARPRYSSAYVMVYVVFNGCLSVVFMLVGLFTITVYSFFSQVVIHYMINYYRG